MIRTSEASEPKPNGIAARALAARGHSGIPVSIIRVDGGTQSRAMLQDSVIEEYAAAIAGGAEFPAIVVYYDGADHWLADGFHRLRAFIAAHLDFIPADVRQGTRRDAILYSVGANEAHGLRRTNDDKRRAVLTLLNDAEWVKWSDREIAKVCHVDHKTVGKFRVEVTGEIPSERTYTTKHGTKATMNTAAIGKPTRNTEDETAVDETATETPVAKSGRTLMSIPEGEDLVALCRRGIALEIKGATAEQAAAEVQLGKNAYRICRQIVMLADNRDLNASDTELAKRAFDLMVSTRQWSGAWEIAEPLANRVWGDNTKQGFIGIPKKRLDQFEHSLGIVMQACMTTDEIELPYLTADRAKKAARQISAARGALERFAARIKEIHPDPSPKKPEGTHQ